MHEFWTNLVSISYCQMHYNMLLPCAWNARKKLQTHAQVSLIDDDSRIALELSLFATNIKKEICGVLESFHFLKRNYEKKKSHNMLYLMLNPRFKSLRLVFSFMGHKEKVSIVEKYDRRPLSPIFFKCYHYSHPMA